MYMTVPARAVYVLWRVSKWLMFFNLSVIFVSVGYLLSVDVSRNEFLSFALIETMHRSCDYTVIIMNALLILL